MYPNVSIKQRTGDELKCVYVGQPLSMYDDLKDGFDHLFLQPCYDEADSVEKNGRSFAITEGLSKTNPEWRFRSKRTSGWVFFEVSAMKASGHGSERRDGFVVPVASVAPREGTKSRPSRSITVRNTWWNWSERLN